MNTLKVAWLFPDTLYLHGERGNILALNRFIKAAGMIPVIEKIDFDTKNFDPESYDIIFCPPGEIVSFPVILEWLAPYKEAFERFIAGGSPLIVTGTSIAMWCRKVIRSDGESFGGMGILKAEAKEKDAVYGDDLYYTCMYNGKQFEIIGSQIQMTDFINRGEKPFGRLYYGYGNTGTDREEGFIQYNSVFTNTLAPVLAVHPDFAAEVVTAAAAAKGITIDQIEYDSDIANKSFATKKEFIETKETRLTNCKER